MLLRDGVGKEPAVSLNINLKPRVFFLLNVVLRAFFVVSQLGINLLWFLKILSV
jgi:hypothetical protein